MRRIGFVQPNLIGYGGVEMYGMRVVQALSQSFPLDVITGHSVDQAKIENAFNVDLHRVRFIEMNPCSLPLDLSRIERWRRHFQLRRRLGAYHLTILNTFTLPDACYSKTGILMSHSTVTDSLKLQEGRQSRPPLAFLTSEGRAQIDIRHRVGSWTEVVTNSQFTRSSFQEFWQKDSVVIYPPVESRGHLELRHRPRRIVGCGFFSGQRDAAGRLHCGLKRQDILIEAFRRLCSKVQNVELLLTGHYVESEANAQLLEQLGRAAEGLPVRFLLNVPHDSLVEEFSKARLFWQATGFGCESSEQVGLVETFGMAMVEAMGCGCVPLAYSAGGAKEVVGPVDRRCVWTTVDELCLHSAVLLENEEDYLASAERSRRRADEFSSEKFEERWIKLVSNLFRA